MYWLFGLKNQPGTGTHHRIAVHPDNTNSANCRLNSANCRLKAYCIDFLGWKINQAQAPITVLLYTLITLTVLIVGWKPNVLTFGPKNQPGTGTHHRIAVHPDNTNSANSRLKA